jgi:small-conductance mechanosensitive channel
VGVFLGALILFAILRSVFARRAARLAARTSTHWDDAVVVALERTRTWFLVILAAYVGSFTLLLPAGVPSIVRVVVILALLAQLGVWCNVLITAGLTHYVKRRQDDPASVMTITALAFLGKLVLFTLLLLLALANLGIDVTALITGLGIGGIAVALAVQNILGDLLASLSIVFDKPFVLGDFIIVGSDMGTVEKIGLKTSSVWYVNWAGSIKSG